MQKHLNFTILTGTIVSAPAWIPLAHNKRALVFTLQNNEHYQLASGAPAVHSNNINIEVLGKNAERYFNELHLHQQCSVVGYLRVDEVRGQDKVRIRAFRIEDLSGDERG